MASQTIMTMIEVIKDTYLKDYKRPPKSLTLSLFGYNQLVDELKSVGLYDLQKANKVTDVPEGITISDLELKVIESDGWYCQISD
ncbi:MAG: hypothetical protein ACE5HI_16880 [bacterium]